MSKPPSMNRKHSIRAVPALGAAGVSLSLASGALAAVGGPVAGIHTPKMGMSHEITLCEEEISDVSLATFYVFDDENVRALRRGAKLAQGGCGCGFGCGGGGGDGVGSSITTYSGAAPLGRYATPPRYSHKPARKKRAGA
jgi:hypothetical protein